LTYLVQSTTRTNSVGFIAGEGWSELERFVYFVRRLWARLFTRPKIVLLKNNSSIVSPLVYEEDGLYRIDFIFGTGGKSFREGEGRLTLGLYKEYSAKPLRQCHVDLSAVKDKESCSFIFEPLCNCASQNLMVALSLHSDYFDDITIAVYCVKGADRESEHVTLGVKKVKVKPFFIVWTIPPAKGKER